MATTPVSGTITINNGRFMGAQDDGLNVHGTHLRIAAQPSPQSVIVQFVHPESYGFLVFGTRDAVQFTRADTLESFGIGFVQTATVLNLTHVHLTFRDAVVGARVGLDVVENLEYTPDVVVTGSVFSRIPTRGLLVTTRGDVVISNNVIHAPLNAALLIADDAESWFESGPVANVLFSQNIVIRNGTWPLGVPGADKPIVLVNPSNKLPSTVHSNVRVLANELHMHVGSVAPVVSGHATSQLFLEGNTIYSPGRPLPTSELIDAQNCSGLSIENNIVITRLEDGVPQ